MMVRVANEKWANRPELQDERRQVLEEAVSFFRTFSAEESQDPLVRRQSARAYFYCATAHLALGEYAKAREMAQSATDVYRSLADDAPTDPAPLRGQAEATAMLGHGEAVAGDYAAALASYETAADLADRAVRLDPANVDSEVTLADINSSLGMYYSISNPPRAAGYLTKTLAIAEKLMADPAAGFKVRLLFVTSLTNAAATDATTGRSVAAATKIDRARAELPALEKLQPPTAHAAERFTLTKAALTVLHGTRLFQAGNRDDGLDAVRAGIQTLAPLVSAQPKSFPLRFQMLQHELVYAELLTRAGRSTAAEDAFRRVDALRDAMLADNPALVWLKLGGAVQKSLLLIEQARAGRAADVEAGFEILLRGLDDRAALPIRYNKACAYAQLVKFGPAADRPAFAEKAVKELDDLLDTPYFQSPVNRTHLDDDTDLLPLQGRDDFTRFLGRAKGMRPPSPSRESAPPPRKVN
jgi:tetratricopeptide (TPR) repeat protein